MKLAHSNSTADVQSTNNIVPIKPKMLVDEHDAIIADLLVNKHKDNIIFDTSRKQWRAFNDGIWHEAEDSERMVWQYYCGIILDISNKKYPELAIGDPKWLKAAMNQSKHSAVLKLVQLQTARGAKQQLGSSNLVGIQDMVYDINVNTCRPALASDLVFKSLGTTYDSKAQCPQWEQFLDTAMQSNTQLIEYLQRLVGYFLTASTREQEIYYFYGSGANGKSTFLDLVKTLLGSYGVKVSSDSFMKKGTTSIGKHSSLATLAGARLAITDETNDSDVAFDSQTLKSISGDDELTGRFLRSNPFTFKSTAKVVMYGNDKPYGNINDEGFWRRFRFIHFGHVIPREQRDSSLLDKLKVELPGILNWALKGLQSWSKHGLQTPQAIIDESIQYREELDSVSEFLKSNTAEEHGAVVTTRQLFEQYNTWCKDNLKMPETMQGFSKRTAHYFERHKQVQRYKNNKSRGFKGVKLS